MPFPLLTFKELAIGIEGFLMVHLILFISLKLIKLIGFSLYKLLITNHYLQAAYDHGYHQRKKSGHHASTFQCMDGKCRLISKYS